MKTSMLGIAAALSLTAAVGFTDPKNKIYVTDMEDALYELDVNTLETRTLIRDGHNSGHFNRLFKKLGVEPPKGWNEAEISDLFGYHGKGTCSGFGRVFYANNGWYCNEAMRNPAIPAGALAWWGFDDSTARRNGYEKMIQASCGGTPAERPDEYVRRSPLTYLPQVRTSLCRMWRRPLLKM